MATKLDERVALDGVVTSKHPTIAICVATYRRTSMLARLLEGFDRMDRPRGYDIEIRIVDNDAKESARAIVEEHGLASDLAIRYATQPERNIAITRNFALEQGSCDLIAFIDDDEVPNRSWLVELVSAMTDELDLVIGDVVPSYTAPPSGWVERGRFHYKSSGEVGDRIGWNGTRTSNTLLCASWIYDRGYRFDPSYGRSGGEDTDLFKRIEQAGGRFGAAPRSIVQEWVHAEQCRVSWLARRFFRNGINYERLVAQDGGRHPLIRFGGRAVRSSYQMMTGCLGLFRGRSEELARAIAEVSRAAGGLVGWLMPNWIERSSGYRSSGCES